MSTIKVNNVIPPNAGEGVKIDGLQMPTAGPLSNRNLIINGAMQVAQRGTTSTPTSGGYFTVDRFSIKNQNSYMADIAPTYAQVEEAPVGFKYSQKVTIGTGTSPTSTDSLWFQQIIEGNNCIHLGLGTATAKQFTLSFWARASIAGDYDVVFRNGAINRHYVTQYTVNTADTWEYKTITVNGDTSGTWLTDNGRGLEIYFTLTISSTSSYATSTLDVWGDGDIRGSTTCTALGATTGATFQITGVQLEVGSKATPFEHRSYGDEFSRCERYYQSWRIVNYQAGYSVNARGGGAWVSFHTSMRAAPGTIDTTSITYSNASGLSPQEPNEGGFGSYFVLSADGTCRCSYTFAADAEL